ncbi:ROK family protein [Microbacterium sp. KUDC0406]|uniref:ROK family protein n=1 Tax=Microbacterium sp. KUDC0406 TaxID=2909588 RepID=UPI001F342015|nr:ROK family protein [Microbacterium sp. KUDC0406]UJP08802.1 ROK family protein [Microbacterium sp. KUDC0406]
MTAGSARSGGRAIRVGLDVGGTKTDAVAIDGSGEILGRVRRPTGWGPDAVVQSIVETTLALAGEAGFGTADIRSVGVGIPGMVDSGSGRVLHAVNLGVESLDIAERAGSVIDAPFAVENDVKAAALGAASLRGDDASMAYLNLGTGVAAGIVAGGRIWRGTHGSAGEVGHISVDPHGRVCGCGQRGCVETLCGGGALARAWGRPGELPVRDIFDAAEAGDPVAAALRADLARGAAAAVRILVLSVDVETVVIGGGLTALGTRLEDDIVRALRADAENSPFMRSLHLDERIELLPIGSPVAALGAALLTAAPAGYPITEKETAAHG